MLNTAMRAAIVIGALAGTASAGGQAETIGLGVESSLSSYTVSGLGGDFQFGPFGGVSLNYDAGQFHAGGLVGFSDGGGDDDTDFVVGGRFFWHVASSGNADFGVGGNLTFVSFDDRGGGDRATLMFLEPGFQIRAFVVPNVALSFTAGIGIGVVDADGIGIAGQATGAAGVHYYFF